MHKTNFRGYKLFFENRQATESMLRQIDDFPSFFPICDDSPWIVDCGANIGVSVLEWKSRWPMARITCFEPDPDAFRLLTLNIEKNDIPGVECIQAALDDHDGNTLLYGLRGRNADTRGNSIRRAWGERAGTSTVSVDCVRLSKHIADKSVAFLKLDIEGAEESVLRDLAPHLQQVNAVYVEVHETEDLVDSNSAARIGRLLSSSGFQLECQSRFGPHSLPKCLDDWRRQVGASQVQILAWRPSATSLDGTPI